MSDPVFVRTEMIKEQAPPVSRQGLLGWLRANLFFSIGSSVVTLIVLAIFVCWSGSC